MTKETKLSIILALLLLFLLAVGLAVWGAWELVSTYVSAPAARAWALIATVLLVPAFILGKNWGQTEARARLKGIDQGVERVAQAGDTMLGMRERAARIVRRRYVQPAPVMLPPYTVEPVVEIRAQTESADVIDL